MVLLSEEYKFEEAHLIKQKMDILEKFQAKSTVVSSTLHKIDVITFLDDDKVGYVNYLVINQGAIIHGITLEVKKNLQTDIEEIIIYALMDFRNRYQSDSEEVLCNYTIQTKLDGITFKVPERGEKKQLIDLSMRNNSFYRLSKLKQEKIKDPERHTNRILEQMQRDLRLKELPIHIECFDNSNIQGTNPVSACVVFKNAKPSNKDYRHFIPKTVEGPDDFKTMEEVVYRRYKRMVDENQTLPNLVVIDGGKGQLGAALKALEKLNLRGKLPIIGLAKRLEEIFFPGDSIPIYLDKRSETLKVIQQIRDEAHRFGITHHRNRRSKNSFHSELENIPGIGTKSFEQLLNHFKTSSKVKSATEEELAQVIGKAKAKMVKLYFSI
jgi:excinuclease ABC subunit C